MAGNLTKEILQLAEKIWNYHQVNHPLEKADCILVLGSHDERVAERGATLYLEGYAPLLIFSGGLGRLTAGMWTLSEAERFSAIAEGLGVPREAILIENRSTNTGENIIYTRQLLKEKGIDPESFILVQKPYMERRAYATFLRHLPHKKVMVTSPQIAFDQYPTADISLEQVIQIMIGDLQRIRIYPSKGFQVEQEIPGDVWDAYLKLVELGFDKQVVH